MTKSSYIGIAVLLIIIGTILSPLVFIWSINTLFKLGIAYGFFEWLASLLFLGILTGGSKLKFSQE